MINYILLKILGERWMVKLISLAILDTICRCKQRDDARTGARHYAARKYSRFFFNSRSFIFFVVCILL